MTEDYEQLRLAEVAGWQAQMVFRLPCEVLFDTWIAAAGALVVYDEQECILIETRQLGRG